MNKQQRTRQILVYAVYIISVCCLQVTFSQVFMLFGRTADLMLVLVVLSGYLFGIWDGVIVGLIVGMLRDYFSSPVMTGLEKEPVAVLGIGMLAFMYIGLLASLIFRRRFRRKYFLGVLQVILLSLIYYSMGYLISWLSLSVSGSLSSYFSLRYIIVSGLLPQILVNVIASIPILVVLRFIGPYSKGIRSGLVDGYSVEDRRWQNV